MADYYPLIARAIAGLDPSAPGESRRALYERARTALIAQLRSVQPPLSESEITRERLSLEEAVRKVESEAAQRAREASRPGGGAAARGGDAFRRANARPPDAPPSASGPAPGGAARPRPPGQPPSRDARPPLGQEEQRPPRNSRPDAPPPGAPRPQPPQIPMQDADLPPTRERSGSAAPRSRQWRAADAATAGHARLPRHRRRRRRSRPRRGAGQPCCAKNLCQRAVALAGIRPARAEHGKPRRRSRGALFLRGIRWRRPTATRRSRRRCRRRASVRGCPGIATANRRSPRRPCAVFPFKSAIAVGIVLILVGAGILWGKAVVTSVSGLFKSSPTAEAPKDPAAPQSQPKIPDRVGQPSSSENIAPVAQRVVLYDEDPGDPKGKQYVGSVIWRTEPVKATGNQKPDIAVRADIEIPDRKFKMTMSFRRNTDSSLPASHTAELTFILPQDFSGGGVGNVPGILMKSNEQARGTPLAGLAVKVTDGFFLVGLSNVDSDRARNLQLLKERSWFDVPLVYANQRRAIIAIEKGAPGERAFNEAFAAWGE